MARLIRGATTAAFRADLATCRVVSGTLAGRALGATISDLSVADELPGAGDATTLLQDEARGVATLVHVRRVIGHALWLWYRLNQAGDVLLEHLREPRLAYAEAPGLGFRGTHVKSSITLSDRSTSSSYSTTTSSAGSAYPRGASPFR